MDKRNCSGCEQNFYNGNNPYGVRECWSFKNAKIVFKKKIHIDQRPPWKQKAIRVPNCYQQKGYVFCDANREY